MKPDIIGKGEEQKLEDLPRRRRYSYWIGAKAARGCRAGYSLVA